MLVKVIQNFVPGRSKRSAKSLDLHSTTFNELSSFDYSVLCPLKL